MENSNLMRAALFAGVAYFLCMAAAHFTGLKWPILFVYFDTPFYAYQDRIISFAVLAYAGLFWVAAGHRPAVPVVLLVMAMTVLGLGSVNLSGALAEVLEPGQGTVVYWLQTGMIGFYLAVLATLYLRDGRVG